MKPITPKKIVRRESAPQHESLCDLHALLQRIYSARSIQHADELDRNLSRLLPFSNLQDIDRAVQLLVHALEQQHTILVVGDFDADGATSTAVCIRALRSFGAQHVHYLVPNRFQFGYGLTPELVKEAALSFSPHLIITVDNGISSHAGVSEAKKHGISVLVTDHHLPAETLPEADAIVNPNRQDDPFPGKCLAGVGVIFYVMLALRRQLINQNWFAQRTLPEPNLAKLLDIVALGTVADLVPLDRNNRILVHHGIERIRKGQCCSGIFALLELSKRSLHQVTASDLGFQVAARLNAAGRLDDMSLGIECLITDDPLYARKCAKLLDDFNRERKLIERDMHVHAIEHLLHTDSNQPLPTGICMFDESWHQGVIGILASRLKERFHRPVIAFAPSQNEIEYKGSGRSIPGVHLRDILAQMATAHPDLILKFGGHAMAAGLSIHKNNLPRFQTIFDQTVRRHVTEHDLNACILSDGELSTEELSIDVARLLQAGGPWGQSFPEPVFDDVFEIVEQYLVGDKHLKLKLKKQNLLLDGIAFFIDTDVWPNRRCRHARMAYQLDINEYRERESLQLIVRHMEELGRADN